MDRRTKIVLWVVGVLILVLLRNVGAGDQQSRDDVPADESSLSITATSAYVSSAPEYKNFAECQQIWLEDQSFILAPFGCFQFKYQCDAIRTLLAEIDLVLDDVRDGLALPIDLAGPIQEFAETTSDSWIKPRQEPEATFVEFRSNVRRLRVALYSDAPQDYEDQILNFRAERTTIEEICSSVPEMQSSSD
jgi:hypothetical protein